MSGKTCCKPGDCPVSSVDKVYMNCDNLKLSDTDAKFLRCLFENDVEVPAEYDEENGRIACTPPKGASLKHVSLKDANGKVVCCNPADCKITWRCDSSCKDALLSSCKDTGCSAQGCGEQIPGGEELEPASAVLKKLSFIDRWLAVWVLLAMGLGLLLGNVVDGIDKSFSGASVVGVSLPIAFGLWLMMFPVLAKVRYELLGTVLSSHGMASQLLLSLAMNWIVGPMLMTGLAWATLSDLPDYRDGVILVGLARCIAMVLIWNHLALGDPELCAVLVAINSIMQVLLYAPMAVFYIHVISGSSDDGMPINQMMREVAKSVAMFLGVPLVAAVIFRYAMIVLGNQLTRTKEYPQGEGEKWLMTKVMPWVGPWALIALLYTIIVMFAMQGKNVVDDIGNVARAGVPMLLYFSILWGTTFAMFWRLGSSYERAVTQAFTTSSNNFELAIAIAVGTYGIVSKQALAATVGPLIEVPVLLALVYVALWVKRKVEFGRNGVPVI